VYLYNKDRCILARIFEMGERSTSPPAIAKRRPASQKTFFAIFDFARHFFSKRKESFSLGFALNTRGRGSTFDPRKRSNYFYSVFKKALVYFGCGLIGLDKSQIISNCVCISSVKSLLCTTNPKVSLREEMNATLSA
jgi:hypothetical protein